MKKRVVVSGIGIISACGCGIESFWNSILQGRQCFNRPDSFDPDPYKSNRTMVLDMHEVMKERNFQALPEAANPGDLICELALRDAIENAGLKPELMKNSGICMGTTTGFPHQRQSFQQGDDPAHWLVGQIKDNYFSDVYSIARKFDWNGPVEVVSSACTSGLISITRAFEFISTGEVDIMVAGGSDYLQELTFAGFNSLRIVSKDICRSFDKNRTGIIIGDGSAFVVLESYEHAVNRGANILCEISGFGISCDACHVVSPSSNGAISAIYKALDDACLRPRDITYINMHGTGTKLNDKAEINAINTVFKEALQNMTANSTKAITGHLLGTAGSIEFIITLLALINNIIPPAVNIEELDPEVEFHINTNGPVRKEMRHAMTNAFGFGGNNISVILSKI